MAQYFLVFALVSLAAVRGPEGANDAVIVASDSSVPASMAPAYLENVYALARSSRFVGRVTHVFWFYWSDGMVPPFGVVGANGSPKAAYWQYRGVAPP